MKAAHTYAASAKRMPALGVVAALCLTGCAQTTRATSDGALEYHGVETRLLDGDLVNFIVSMRGPVQDNDVAAYATCAAAQYALIRGFGFARHVRTTVSKEAGNWRGDAVYTISAALPDGNRTIDAEVIVANCHDTRIPTV